MELCTRDDPPLFDLGGTHFAACHNHDKVTKDQAVWEKMDKANVTV